MNCPTEAPHLWPPQLQVKPVLRKKMRRYWRNQRTMLPTMRLKLQHLKTMMMMSLLRCSRRKATTKIQLRFLPKKIRKEMIMMIKKKILFWKFKVSQEKKRLSNLFLPSNNLFSLQKWDFVVEFSFTNECKVWFFIDLKNQNLYLFSPQKTKSLILFVFIFLNLYVGKVKNVKLRVNLSMFFFFFF